MLPLDEVGVFSIKLLLLLMCKPLETMPDCSDAISALLLPLVKARDVGDADAIGVLSEKNIKIFKNIYHLKSLTP